MAHQQVVTSVANAHEVRVRALQDIARKMREGAPLFSDECGVLIEVALGLCDPCAERLRAFAVTAGMPVTDVVREDIWRRFVDWHHGHGCPAAGTDHS